MTDMIVRETARSNGPAPDSRRRAAKPGRAHPRKASAEKIRVFVAAENRLLPGILSPVLTKRAGNDVIATHSAAPFHTEALLEVLPDILLLNSRRGLYSDVAALPEA